MYNPHRSLAYEYAFDAIEDVESNQCVSCKFADTMPDSIMCWEAQGNIMFEKPVEFMDELANERVVCRRYEAISS